MSRVGVGKGWGGRLLLLGTVAVLVPACGGDDGGTVLVIVWPSTNPQNVSICTAVNDQFQPQIASDGAGGAIMVWYDGRGGTNYDIYAQRVSSAGAVQWTSDGVAICTVANNQMFPQIVTDGSGGAIFVWQDYRAVTTSGIYAQRVNSAGAVQWATNGVAICTVAIAGSRPKIISDGSGGAIIVWEDWRGGNYDIYAQRVDGAGAVQWATNGVPLCTAVGEQSVPQITTDGSGGAIVVWQDYRSGTNYDIYAQRVDGAGAVQWATNGVPLCTAANEQSQHAVVSDGSSGAIIVWYDGRTGMVWDIYAQRVNGVGTVQWATDGVAICTAPIDRVYPQIVSDGSGGAVMVWYDRRSGTNWDIYAQGISAGGLQ